MPAIAAYKRLEHIRHRLPTSPLHNNQPRCVADILALADDFDTFLFDAFGVLNVGQQAIANAPEQVRALRDMGKNVLIVSNASSYDKSFVEAKFQRFGFDFSQDEIVTSRDALLEGLDLFSNEMLWGVIADTKGQDDLRSRHLNLVFPDAADFLAADGFLFLSGAQWGEPQQHKWLEAMHHHARPVLLGNPDLIAPMGDHSSVEPGSYILTLDDTLFEHVYPFGKPFHGIYDIVTHRLSKRNIPFNHTRTIMLGDTLHTDILGGNAYGIATGLVSDHGFFKGLDVLHYINDSGIVPDFILPQL